MHSTYSQHRQSKSTLTPSQCVSIPSPSNPTEHSVGSLYQRRLLPIQLPARTRSSRIVFAQRQQATSSQVICDNLRKAHCRTCSGHPAYRSCTTVYTCSSQREAWSRYKVHRHSARHSTHKAGQEESAASTQFDVHEVDTVTSFRSTPASAAFIVNFSPAATAAAAKC